MNEVEFELRYQHRTRPVTICVMAPTDTECWVQLQNILDKEVKMEMADVTIYRWDDDVNKELVTSMKCNAYGITHDVT